MNAATVGNKPERVLEAIRNADTVAILAGSPVFLKLTPTVAPGADVVAGPNGNVGMFFGIATGDIAIGDYGYAITSGYTTVRAPAASTGNAGDSFLPTVGSAGVYSCAAGTATALTARILLTTALIADSAESNRAKVFLARR